VFAEHTYPEIEARLADLAVPLEAPQEWDWLAEHPEDGQTFAQYLAARPVRKDAQLHTIYLCLLGDLTAPQRRVLELTQEYLGLAFTAPVVLRKHLPLSAIPESARRVHPLWGDRQVLSTYVLRQVLKPDRPADALAYLAFTAADLYPKASWNFVFGQANLRRRTGVWSLYRNGDPGGGASGFRLCLRRTLATAVHETGHILTLEHCTANRCLMNGSNTPEERDRKPLYPCPVCLRKLAWNLQFDPVAYLASLESFCRREGLEEDAAWFGRAGARLKGVPASVLRR
jgi:archaemetzincin